MLAVSEVHESRVALVEELALHGSELVEERRLLALCGDGVGHCGHLHVAHGLVDGRA